MIFKEDKGTGYMYCYYPEHPTANAAGKVMEHVYVMYNHIGRQLKSNECVHHIDRDKKNNLLSNLMLMDHDEHSKLHAVEDRNYKEVQNICPICQNTFVHSAKIDIKYCSNECKCKSNRKFEVEKEFLKDLVWNYPTVKVAKMFGVSDTAIAKRCKQLGVEKPPRGYWSKVRDD